MSTLFNVKNYDLREQRYQRTLLFRSIFFFLQTDFIVDRSFEVGAENTTSFLRHRYRYPWNYRINVLKIAVRNL